MSAPTLRTWLARGTIGALAASGLLFSWAVERSSIQRANRLHREGAFDAASMIYRTSAGVEGQSPAVDYNLGTSLLGLGSSSAEAALESGTASADTDVQARSFYNTGLLSLTRALDPEVDSTRAHATAAVEANRTALRLRPDHPNTKWNLAMAQRLLDSIDAADRRSGRETAEGAVEVEEVVNSENVADVDEENELPEDAPLDGEDEALAQLDEEAALTPEEAEEILGRTHLHGAVIVQKLIALESRGFWGRRIRRSGPRR